MFLDLILPQEHAAALSNLAHMYLHGLGVDPDKQKAAELMKRAQELEQKQKDHFYRLHDEAEEKVRKILDSQPPEKLDKMLRDLVDTSSG